MQNKKKLGQAFGTQFPLSLLLLLSVFFLVGVVLGQVWIGYVPDAVGLELRTYLHRFLQLGQVQDHTAETFFSAVFLYFRYPALVFFFGLASVGVVLVPCLTAAFGFFLSFSVCCFVATFGIDGVWVSLAILGLRCIVTLPSYFILAVHSFSHSAALAARSFGRGRRLAVVRFEREEWRSLVVSCVVLLLGVCLDLMISPVLLSAILQRLFG